MTQSPAPVAGAVEALRLARQLLECGTHDPARKHPDDSPAKGRWTVITAPTELVETLRTALAQPAPAVAVEAVEAWKKLKFVHRVLGNFAHAPQSDRADAYAMVGELIKSTWLAARSVPAVAEKVPLTPEQAKNVWRRWLAAGHVQCDWLSLLRLTEAAHGIGSGSAQEGQANG